MFGNTIGPGEIAIILVIALLIFGPKKLPELGKGLGRGMRDFKRAVSGDDDDERKEEETKTKAEIPPTAVVEAPIVQAPVVATPAPAEVVVEAAAEPAAAAADEPR